MVLKSSSSSEIQEFCEHEKAKDAWDRISNLPDAILVHILSSIPTRDAVQTSTLSKRWRNVWTTVPVIEISSSSLWFEYREYVRKQTGSTTNYYFEGWFMNFVDRVLLLNNEVSCVRKLHLSFRYEHDLSRVREWINFVARLNDVEELDLEFWGCSVELPPSTFTSKKLVILKLTRNILLNIPLSISLPRLKKLHLASVKTLDVDSVKTFLTSCPVLEELKIERCSRDKMKKKALYVQSISLKSLTFYSGGFNGSARLLKLVIDAANLERLDLIVDGKKPVDVNTSMSSLVKVELSVRNSYLHSTSTRRNVYEINVLELLMKMSNTKYLYLSSEAMESLEQRGLDYLPMLKNLMSCQVNIYCCSWSLLPCLLESSPNLISFVLYKNELRDCPGPHRKSHTPKCLMLYLEEIELHGFSGYEYEMEIVRYLLKNAPALKKMYITFVCLKPEEVSDLHSRVLKLPKASTACAIGVRGF